MEKNTLAKACGKTITPASRPAGWRWPWVDTRKINKSFVDGLRKDPESDAAVAAAISPALPRGPEVTAEGVGIPVQMVHLHELSRAREQRDCCAGPLPAEAAKGRLAGIFLR